MNIWVVDDVAEAAAAAAVAAANDGWALAIADKNAGTLPAAAATACWAAVEELVVVELAVLFLLLLPVVAAEAANTFVASCNALEASSAVTVNVILFAVAVDVPPPLPLITSSNGMVADKVVPGIGIPAEAVCPPPELLLLEAADDLPPDLFRRLLPPVGDIIAICCLYSVCCCYCFVLLTFHQQYKHIRLM